MDPTEEKITRSGKNGKNITLKIPTNSEISILMKDVSSKYKLNNTNVFYGGKGGKGNAILKRTYPKQGERGTRYLKNINLKISKNTHHGRTGFR